MIFRIILTTIKSALLATFLFIALFNQITIYDIFIASVITFVITAVISFFMILFTLLPFKIIGDYFSYNNVQIFQVFFPYYAMVSFAICTWFIVISKDDNMVKSLFFAAFFTSIMAWYWLFKKTN